MTEKTPDLLRVIIAGALVLLVVHTLGRFIYTPPLLPWLVDDGLLTLKQGRRCCQLELSWLFDWRFASNALASCGADS